MKLIQLMPLYIRNLDNILDQNRSAKIRNQKRTDIFHKPEELPSGLFVDHQLPLDNSEAERKIRNFVISRNAVLIDTVNEQKQAHPVFTCGDCQGIHPETV